ncbi:MAG: PQQ-binding-like beta-propeller repeat protein, partial [Chloroflexota bacterium]
MSGDERIQGCDMSIRRGFVYFMLTVLVGIVFLLWFVLSLRLAFERNPWPDAVVNRTETNLPATFEPVMHLTDVFIELNRRSTMFFLVEDSLHIVGAFDAREGPELTRIELPTQRVVWNTSVPIGADVTHNSEHVYVETGGLARVMARELETGTEKWSAGLFPRNSIGAMTADDTTVFVETVPLSFYFLDADTGEIIDERKDYTGLPIYSGRNDVVLFHLRRSILAQSLETGSDLWRNDFADDVTWVKVSGNSRLLLRTGRDWGHVYAIDVDSGDILW